MTDSARSRAVVAGLIGITIVAAALRLYRLGEPSLWGDEVLTADLCRLPLGRMFAVLARHDVHPPLFALLERIATTGGIDEWHLRLVPLIASVATVPIVFLLGRELLGARTGLVAAALVAVTPCMVWYGREARSNSLFALIAMTATLLLVVALRRGRTRDHVAYAVALVAAFYTHNFTVLLVAAHLAIVAIRWRTGMIDRKTAARWALATAAAAIVVVPWWIVARPALAGLDWVPPARPGDLAALARFAWFGETSWVQFDDAFLGADGVIAIVAFIVLELVVVRPKRTEAIHLVSLAAVIAIPIAAGFALSWLVRPVMVARFYLAFLVPLYLIVAYGIARRSLGVGAVLVGLLAWRLVPATHWILTETTNADLRAVAAQLRTTAGPDDAVLVAPRWDRTFAYYSPDRPGLPVDDTTLDPATVCRLAARHPHAWLVWSDREPRAVAAHDRLTTAWHEVSTTTIAGPLHGGFHLSRYDARTDGCATPAAPAAAHCTTTFRLTGRRDAHTVWATGDFTDWAAHPALGAIPLARGADGAWSATADVPAGTHQYKLIIDGTDWITDPANPTTAVTDGNLNSVLTCD